MYLSYPFAQGMIQKIIELFVECFSLHCALLCFSATHEGLKDEEFTDFSSPFRNADKSREMQAVQFETQLDTKVLMSC